MNLNNIIDTDLKAITSELGKIKFTWRSEEYECIPSSTGTLSVLEEGGIGVDADLAITVRKSLFIDGIYPVSQDKVTYKGVKYRIVTVREDLTAAIMRLLLVDENK